MNASRIFVCAILVLVPGAFLAGRATSAENGLVKARKYRVLYAESGLELSHGGGRWVEEVFFPDRKVSAFLLRDYEFVEGAPGRWIPRLVAIPAEKPRNDLTGSRDPKPSTIREIEVPAELANRIAELAALFERQRREARRLGREVEDAGVLGHPSADQDDD